MFSTRDLATLRSLVSEEQRRAAKKLSAAASADESTFYSDVMNHLAALEGQLAERGATQRLDRAIAAEEAALEGDTES